MLLTSLLTNSWLNNGGPGTGGVPAYRKIGNQVRVAGAIASGTNGTTAFTFPAGFRPTAGITAFALGGGPLYNNFYSISSGGAFVAQMTTGPTANGLFLDGITFLVD